MINEISKKEAEKILLDTRKKIGNDSRENFSKEELEGELNYEINATLLGKYSRVLLSPKSREGERIFRKEIAERRDVRFLKEIFFPTCFKEFLGDSQENSLEKYRNCIYRLFIFFADAKFIEKSYSRDVFDWLADEKIEEIIERNDQGMKMAHLLAMYNNLQGLEWVFERYHKELDVDEDKLRRIFDTRDECDQDIFDHLVNGIIEIESSSSTSQVGVIRLVLREFGETIKSNKRVLENGNSKKEQLMNEKKNSIRSMLAEEVYLTQKLEEQFI